MFVARVAVDHLREVELHVESTFGRRRDLIFDTRLSNPLTHIAVTDDVLLERVGLIRIAVAFDVIEDRILILKPDARENARASGENTWAKYVARLDEIGVSVNVGR